MVGTVETNNVKRPDPEEMKKFGKLFKRDNRKLYTQVFLVTFAVGFVVSGLTTFATIMVAQGLGYVPTVVAEYTAQK